MFIWAILAALAVTASADDEYCSTKTAGVSTSKSEYLLPVIADGNCNLRVDLSFVYGCNNKGVYVSTCDYDATPLVSIQNDLNYLDITREGNCRDEAFAFVLVYCQDPIPMVAARSSSRNLVTYN